MLEAGRARDRYPGAARLAAGRDRRRMGSHHARCEKARSNFASRRCAPGSLLPGLCAVRCALELKRLQADELEKPARDRNPLLGLVDATPSGYKQISALMQAYNRAADATKSHAAEFGWSPAARQRVQGQAQASLFPDSAAMAAFLRATRAD